MGDNILVKADHNKSKYDNGPYAIVQLNNNGALMYQKGSKLDIINTRNVHSYKE